MKSHPSTLRFWRFAIIVLAVIVYAAAMIGFGRRAGVFEFVSDLLSWPSVSKWFISYSALYFTGALLMAFSIQPCTSAAPHRVRRGSCICGVLALVLGGFAIYTIFDSLAFNLQA